MSGLRIVAAESAAGRSLRRRLAGRLGRVLDPAVERRTARLVEAVRRGGDAALVAAARELDGFGGTAAPELRLVASAADRAGSDVPEAVRAAIELAIEEVEAFHRAQLAASGDGFVADRNGVRVVETVGPLERVGLYVPGGLASYPSTAIMTAIPARVAGVRRIAVATPAKSYAAQPALRYTLARLGVDEVWGCGGAHAIAAFAYGTESVERVDLIAGPGNAWVTAAKRRVAGVVAVDGLMGPSEVVIVAGDDADPEWIAADLLAQAEHDPRAAALLVTVSRRLARAVAAAVDRLLPELATAETARTALRAAGGALLVADLEAAIALARELAPEHLQLVGAEVEGAATRFERAGAIFVGAATPEVFGDYVAGPSHVLPTCGSARFASGLNVETFRRRTHRIAVTSAETIERFARAAAALATAEGLPAHAAAAALRATGKALRGTGKALRAVGETR